MAHDDGPARGLDFARRMALGLVWFVGTVALLLPLALFWAPFGALTMRVSGWALLALLVAGCGLIAWEVAAYLRAEWRARD